MPRRSRSVTRAPAADRKYAHAAPTIPPPMTTTSGGVVLTERLSTCLATWRHAIVARRAGSGAPFDLPRRHTASQERRHVADNPLRGHHPAPRHAATPRRLRRHPIAAA